MPRARRAAAIDPAMFRALAEPTRIHILSVLMRAGGEANVSAIAQEIPVDLSVVSRHLRELVQGGVLEAERHGRERWYRLRYEPMIQQFETLLEQLKSLRDGKGCC